METDTVEITIEKIERQSELAILVSYEGKEYWLPKSHLFGYDDDFVGEENIKIEASQWILEEKGMI